MYKYKYNNRTKIITVLASSKWLEDGGSYLVTLNVLSRRTHLNTERPRGGMTPLFVKISSRILLITTKQSKRLKSETKYPWK